VMVTPGRFERPTYGL